MKEFKKKMDNSRLNDTDLVIQFNLKTNFIDLMNDLLMKKICVKEDANIEHYISLLHK